MDTNNLVLLALGLQPEDVKIESFNLNTSKLTATITIRHLRSNCKCPDCLSPLFGVKQWRKRVLHGISLGAFQKVTLVFFQLQAACGECLRYPLALASFIHPKFKNMTSAFAEQAGRWLEETTCAAVERMTDCSAMSLWRLDQWRIEKLKKEFSIPTDLPMSFASADEVHMRTLRPKTARLDKSQWEKKYITNLVSCDLGKVISNASGRSGHSLQNCLKQLPDEVRDKIKFIAVDMHDGYIAAASKMCPDATVTVDRFHVAEALNKAFDELRQNEFDKAKTNNDTFQIKMLKPSNKYILTARSKEIPKHDKINFQKLIQVNQNISSGLILVDYFHKILDKNSIQEFKEGLELWEELVEQSQILEFKKFLNTVKKYQSKIEAYILSKLTTAISEGLNNKIKVLKRVGYNYTNEKSFKNKILQRCGFLNSRNINTNQWFWHVTSPH